MSFSENMLLLIFYFYCVYAACLPIIFFFFAQSSNSCGQQKKTLDPLKLGQTAKFWVSAKAVHMLNLCAIPLDPLICSSIKVMRNLMGGNH